MFAIGPSVFGQQWHEDLNTASRIATAENKKVLMYFSVNEHCETCRKLEQDFFSSTEFLNYASANLVLVKPKFSAQVAYEEKAEKLQIVEKYNKDGFFPHIVLLDASLKILKRAPLYQGEDAARYLQHLR